VDTRFVRFSRDRRFFHTLTLNNMQADEKELKMQTKGQM
jgi:hypothetical protein